VLTTDAVNTTIESTRITIITISRIDSSTTVHRVTEGPGAGTVWIGGGTVNLVIVTSTVSANVIGTDVGVGTVENGRVASTVSTGLRLARIGHLAVKWDDGTRAVGLTSGSEAPIV